MANNKYLGTYQIPVSCISVIVNDDYSGLSDDDENAIKSFLASFKDGFTADWLENIDDSYFSVRNDIFGYFGAEVVDVNFYSVN